MDTKLKGKFFGLEHYDVRPLDGENWIVQNPGGLWGYEYQDGTRMVPPDGFEFDYASVPRLAWRLIGPPTGHGKGECYGLPAIFHDMAYEFGKIGDNPCNRRQADWMMLDLMCHKEQQIVNGHAYWLVNVTWARRNIMWMALRIGGNSHWAKHGHGR